MAPRRSTPTDAQREKWAAERKAKLTELHQRIVNEVAKLTDGEQWRKWLTFASRFHGYSFGNLMLIMAQRPDAVQVAGYKRWEQLGRHVRKGEKGIWILAPITRRITDQNRTEQPEDRVETGLVEPAADETQQQSSRVTTGFKAVAVFDLSQTERCIGCRKHPNGGQEIEVPTLPQQATVTPQQLSERAPTGLWDELVRIAEGHGYTVKRGDCGKAYGYTNYNQRLVMVRDDLNEVQAVETLIHEMAHVKMHEPAGWLVTTAGCRGEREVEAESVTFLVAARYNLDTSSFSFPYVTGWAQDAARQTRITPEDVVRATAQRVITTAAEITKTIDANLDPSSAAVSPTLAARIRAGVDRAAAARAAAESATAAVLADAQQAATASRNRTPMGRAFPLLHPTLQAVSATAPTTAASVSTLAQEKGPRRA